VAADPADVAVLVRDILRVAAARDRDGMIALIGAHRDPDVLGAVAVMLGAELAGMRLDALAGAVARFEGAAASLAAGG
jgi:hypothetical protein